MALKAGDKATWADISGLYERLNTQRTKFSFSTVSIPNNQNTVARSSHIASLNSFIVEMRSNSFLSSVIPSSIAAPTVGTPLTPPSTIDTLLTTITNTCAFGNSSFSDSSFRFGNSSFGNTSFSDSSFRFGNSGFGNSSWGNSSWGNSSWTNSSFSDSSFGNTAYRSGFQNSSFGNSAYRSSFGNTSFGNSSFSNTSFGNTAYRSSFANSSWNPIWCGGNT